MWNAQLPPAECYTTESPELDGLVREVTDRKEVAIDTETTGLTLWKDIPLFWSLSWDERRIFMPASTLFAFEDAFRDRTKDWVLANAKYDKHILANVGFELKGNLIDTQVMHALLYEEEFHALKKMSRSVLGWTWKDFNESFPQRVENKVKESIGDTLIRAWDNVPNASGVVADGATREDLIEYGANDAYGTYQIYLRLKDELQATPTDSLWPECYETLWDLFWKTEMPYTSVLWKCERNGCLIDVEYLENLRKPMLEEVEKIKREFCRQAGRNINSRSPLELEQLFIKERGLKALKLTATKRPSLDAEFFEHYASQDSLCKLEVEKRVMEKTVSTFIDGVLADLDPGNRVHTRLNQDVARTGRLSSQSPNLQNLPNPERDKFQIRKAFKVPKGHKMISGDYSALEMRLLAAASEEQSMIDIFLQGKDIHMGNVSLVFGEPYDEIVEAKSTPKDKITPRQKMLLEYRSQIKVVGFGINYGMGVGLLARNIGKSEEEAQAILDKYMATYPGVQRMMDEFTAVAMNTGCSYTILGRRRYLPGITSKNRKESSRARRQCTNHPIQGSAQDTCKMAMLMVDAIDVEGRYGAKMLLAIHDELMFECPEETAQQAMVEIKYAMEHPFLTDLKVPLDVNICLVDNWAEAK